MISASLAGKLDDTARERIVGELTRRKVSAIADGNVRYTLPA